MNNNRNQAAAFPLLALILFIFSPAAFAAPEPNAILELTGEGLTYLEVEFRSREGKDLGRYQFRESEGLVVGGIALPDEAGAEYEITAFDADGIATYSGAGAVPSLGEGDRPLELPLLPTDKEKGPEAASRGGIVVSVSRERLVLEARESGEPDNFTVRLQALDARGDPLKLDADGIRWGVTDPNHFELIPLKDRYEVVIRPRVDFPGIFNFCSKVPKVVGCTPTHCKMLRVCPDPWVSISAGRTHSCAVTKNGFAYCWGVNNWGELGAPTYDGCPNSRNANCSARPQAVVCPAGAPCRFTQISAGSDVTVAIDINGDAWWWGDNMNGHQRVTAIFGGRPVIFKQVTAGFRHGCGLSTDDQVWCWGSNYNGEAGAPMVMTKVPDFAPVRVLATLNMKFMKVVAGGQHTCALNLRNDAVVCWGRDDQNQTRGPNPSPYPAGGGQFFFQNFGATSIYDVAASEESTCVTLGNSNGVRCWGRHWSRNTMLLGAPHALSIGAEHLCGLTVQQASCMGTGYSGQLGYGGYLNQPSPVPVSSPPADFAAVSAGAFHTCGLTPAGDAYCWGNNLSGQVGDGSYNYGRPLPTKVQIP